MSATAPSEKPLNTLNSPVSKQRVMRSSDVSIEWRDSVESIPASFWDQCFRPPFEGRWWYEALEKSGLESQFRFIYGLIKISDHPAGIVPAFFMDVPIEIIAPPWVVPYFRALGKFYPRVLYQPTLFIGSPCSDEGTIGLLPGINLEDVIHFIHREAELQAALADSQMIVYKDFPLECVAALDSLRAPFGLFHTLSYPGTVVTLRGKSIDDYYQSLKSSHRHNLKKKLKRSREKVNLVESVIQSPDGKVLEEIWGLFWQTYEKGETKFERLTPEFFSLIAKSSASHFVLLRHAETNQLVAFMLCFKIGNRVINKFIGIDYKRPAEWFLYFRLWDAALRWVIAIGGKEFQSGQTGYRGKIDVGHNLVPLVNFARNRYPIFHEVYRRIGPTITWQELDKDLETYIKAHPEKEFRLR